MHLVVGRPYVERMRTAGVLWIGLTLLVVGGCARADKEFRDERTIESGVAAITIDGGAGSVRITGTDGGSVHVKRHVRYGGDKPGATDEVSGAALTLHTGCGVACSVDYEVTAPKTVRVAGRAGSGNVSVTNVSTAAVTVSSGGLRVRDVAGALTARSSSGSIDISGVAGAVTAKSSSGGIRVDDVGGALTAEASSGSISATDLRGGHTSAHTSSGGITLDLAAAQDVDAEATSGDVKIGTGADQRYRISTDTSSGGANVKVPTDPSADHYLRLSTSSGGITVERR
jgi:hypothetical protein